MKGLKVFLFVGLLFLPLCASAVTMCLRDDSFVAMLLRERDGTSVETGENKSFQVNFDYYTSTKNKKYVRGIGACNEISGTVNVANKDLSTSISDEGINCWCSMKSPLVGDWVFANAYGSDADCASNCAAKCADMVKTSQAFRSVFYENIW